MKSGRTILVLFLLSLFPLVGCSKPSYYAPERWVPQTSVSETNTVDEIKAAADAGDPRAMHLLFSLGEKSGVPQFQLKGYLIRAAELKYYPAMLELSSNYADGINGFPKDLIKSIYWAQRTVCYHGGEMHIFLAGLYGADVSKTKKIVRAGSSVSYREVIRPEEKALVKENLPLAYAHLNRISSEVIPNVADKEKDLLDRMTPMQRRQAEFLAKMLKNGMCPYSECEITPMLGDPLEVPSPCESNAIKP